jgi:small lipoprotein (TIGR04454 family)
VRWLMLCLLIACGGKKDEGPTCEQVTDRILEVTAQALEGHQNTNLPSQRKAMIDQCEKRQMSLETRTCLMGAKTIAEIATCRGRGKPNIGERPRRPRPQLGSGSATVGSGSATTGSGSATVGSGSATSGKTGSGSGSAR